MAKDEVPPEPDRLEGQPHPRETATLAGHDRAEADFLDAFRSGKVHSGWLIGGPKGIGKATLAYRVARFALKYGLSGVPEGAADLHVPEDNPTFRRVAQKSHGNLLVLRRPWDDKAKKLKTVIPVEEVRRLGSFFGQHAAQAGWRVVVVDSADEMNVNAANALLKLLEEPPARSLFLLISHSPGRLLPTIRSRCRKLTLKPLPEDELGRLLVARGAAASVEEAAPLARLAKGSAGAAFQLAEGGGLGLYTQLVEALNTLPHLDGDKVGRLADRLAAKQAEQDYEAALSFLDDWLERLARRAATGETVPDIVPGEARAAARLVKAGAIPWLDARREIHEAAAKTQGLNLDRKALVIHIFGRLRAAAAAA